MGKVVLTGKGRRWFLSRHPWIFADDLASAEGEPGELLGIEDPQGKRIGWGLFSRGSKIAVRVVSRDAAQPDRAFWLERIVRAVARRERLGLLEPAGACRLLSGDAEGVPGLVIDRYADAAVLQCGTQSADRMRDFLVELLEEALPLPLGTIVDRSDLSVRRLESLERRVEVLRGEVEGAVEVREGELVYEVDLLAGHKTGAFLDQRANRAAAARRAEGRRVLDAFSYDGLFGIRAALAGASSVVCLDQNAAAGERLLRCAERNGVADRVSFERVNAMKSLRDRAAAGESFGLVILDPPAFARNRRELSGARRGYGELNLRGMGLVEPGGHLVSCSCSFALGRELFLEILTRSARDTQREVYLEELRGAAPDHPVHLCLPESAYLKCAVLRVE